MKNILHVLYEYFCITQTRLMINIPGRTKIYLYLTLYNFSTCMPLFFPAILGMLIPKVYPMNYANCYALLRFVMVTYRSNFPFSFRVTSPALACNLKDRSIRTTLNHWKRLYSRRKIRFIYDWAYCTRRDQDTESGLGPMGDVSIINARQMRVTR